MEDTKNKEIIVGDLNDLADGLQALGGLHIVNHELNSAVVHNIVKVKRELKILRKTMNALKKQYAKKDDKGEFVTHPIRTKDGQLINAHVYDNEEEFSGKVDELEKQPIQSRLYFIKKSTLNKEKIHGLTPVVEAKLDAITVHDVEIPECV